MAVAEGGIDAGALLDILCASGFSTRDEADRGSGRGVGMAVVRSTVHDLGGTLAVDSESGRGTTFRITLPLTLAITDAIIAHVGPHTFAVPQAAVRELIEVEATSLRTIERNELLAYRGSTLPIIRLSHLFGIGAPPRTRFSCHRRRHRPGRRRLLVDRIGGQREVVVRRSPIVDPCRRRLGRNRAGRRAGGADSGRHRVEPDRADSARAAVDGVSA
jgi:two-component system chemotaxis sensor kinase CheA